MIYSYMASVKAVATNTKCETISFAMDWAYNPVEHQQCPLYKLAGASEVGEAHKALGFSSPNAETNQQGLMGLTPPI